MHRKKLPLLMRFASPALVVAAAAFLWSCRPVRPVFSPLPPQVNSIEGYASFRLTREGAAVKSRFSFLFLLPDRGRIEVSDPLGRTVSLLFLEKEEAFFVLPRKRAYWKASREEVLSKLLGFTLSPEEMTSLLSGKPGQMKGWVMEEDGRGRVVRGRRDDLQFEIRQFYGQSSLPQLISLFSAADRGSLKILRLNFNQPLKAEAFKLAFLEDATYAATTWEEIEKWLQNER
jgi:outer membrane biogenesis lipoprotein LolB